MKVYKFFKLLRKLLFLGWKNRIKNLWQLFLTFCACIMIFQILSISYWTLIMNNNRMCYPKKIKVDKTDPYYPRQIRVKDLIPEIDIRPTKS